MSAGRSHVVAVDGGGSKTDVLVATIDGHVVGRKLGPGSSQHSLGAARATKVIDAIVGAGALMRPESRSTRWPRRTAT